MSFTIEAPGAAAPLSFHELYRVLHSACDYHAQSQAPTQQLAAWESQEQYYPLLQVCQQRPKT